MKAIQLQLDEINDGLSRPPEIKPTKTSKVGVLGSGLMGHGIAYVTALAGMKVVMIDTSQENVDKGLNRIKTILQDSCDKGLIPKGKITDVISRINATDDYSQLIGCDLIIEAVFEHKELKAKVTSDSEKFLKSNGILASNTSSIPITSLSENIINPEKFIGIHFFSPVHKMKLVEIIKGKKTDSRTLAKAFDYVIKIKKVPIVVNDSRGFYTSRVFERYTGEGMTLLSEGNSAEAIEAAGKKAGYPVGPLAVIDEINIGLAADIRDQGWHDLEAEGKDLPRGPWDNVIDFMTKKVKRTGRAGGGGFYEYPKEEKKYLWPELKNHFPFSDTPLDEKEMIDRFHFSQSIETIRCYEEGVLSTVAEANIGSLLGWGFPSFTGGTLQFVNAYGIQKFKDRSQELSDKYGDRFSPPKLLDRMINENRYF
tara:strand:- start:77 stop:1351 length:1275 start_codon:yes stop_codon:yes gene_type:complete